MTYVFRFSVIAAATALLLAAGSAQAATPKWTPAKASSAMRGKCVGIGKPTVGRFASFKCTSSGRTVWAKVRPDGKKLCWSVTSLSAVPPLCMTISGRG